MKVNLLLLTILFLTACQGQNKQTAASASSTEISETDWKKKLTPEQYAVLREKGTEAPFTGEYVNTFDAGTYVCAGCGSELFDSDTKFETDCGWPSFDKAKKGAVIYEADYSFGMVRTEVMCVGCGGHLGHVFDDGPKETTGKRYCTNSVSIKFIPKNKMP